MEMRGKWGFALAVLFFSFSSLYALPKLFVRPWGPCPPQFSDFSPSGEWKEGHKVVNYQNKRFLSQEKASRLKDLNKAVEKGTFKMLK